MPRRRSFQEDYVDAVRTEDDSKLASRRKKATDWDKFVAKLTDEERSELKAALAAYEEENAEEEAEV